MKMNSWGLLPFLKNNNKVVSFYGAGGKTSLIYSLANEILEDAKKHLLITTTTRIRPPEKFPLVLADNLAEAKGMISSHLEGAKGLVLGRKLLSSGKLQGIPAEWIDDLSASSLVDTILVEADGAAGRPAKGFAPYEPVLPASTTALVPVLGLDAWGKPLTDNFFHRVKELSLISRVQENQPFTLHALARLLNHMIHMGNQEVPGALIIPCLNKNDLLQDSRILYQELPVRLKGTSCLLFTSTREKPLVQGAYMKSRQGILRPWISAVILAAGTSARMGTPKLLLRLADKEVLSYTLEAALSSRVDEVVVVLPPGSEELQALVQKYPVNLIENPLYLEGQATSLKAGLHSIASFAQAALFLLGDQPLLKSPVIDQLVESYLHFFSWVHYPLYKGKRGNPVLFDRRLFPDLLALQGDKGGRCILKEQRYLCRPVSTRCPGAVIDLDTPEDFARLQKYME